MYTRNELEHAASVIAQIARECKVPEKAVRAEMKKAMDAGRASQDPDVQARWRSFSYTGAEPTVEEFILWCVETVSF
ncbi:MAG: hypothetical protein IKS66_03200 [Oscillospiraceae bacterium]|nr:hypothetical protein [Oscillospiraceae bacterium]